MATRRGFLKLSGIGLAALLGGGYVAAGLTDGSPAPLLDDAASLSPPAQQMLYAVCDAVLSDMMPKGQEHALLTGTLARIDAGLSALPPALLKEVQSLLSLLTFAPSRLAVSGRWGGWESAGRGEVAAWLNDLRGSRFGLRRLIFITLHDLATSGFYAQPETWPLVGYTGPLLHGPGAEI